MSDRNAAPGKSLGEIWRQHSWMFLEPDYERAFEAMFAPVRFEAAALLELGIWQGDSLQIWAEYFPHAIIAGVDLLLPSDLPAHDRIRMYAADQADLEALSRIAKEIAPQGFDIVIDDCSHIAKLAKASFWHLFDNHMKPGGLYLIEDWATGYWPWWPDGRATMHGPDAERRMPSHDAGMVGFLKQLVDVLNEDIIGMTKDQLHAKIQQLASAPGEWCRSKFESMTFYSGMCAIRKAQ